MEMGFQFGLEKSSVCFKRKFRWLFKIEEISAMGINTLPPVKGARPSMSFKELEVKHLTEDVYFPGKSEWKPITLTLFDLKQNKHPVFEWIKKIYNPQNDSLWTPVLDAKLKKTGTLELYDGCGTVIEKWTLDNIWPQSSEFGELDMSSSDYLVCDVTLRYDRAYIED